MRRVRRARRTRRRLSDLLRRRRDLTALNGVAGRFGRSRTVSRGPESFDGLAMGDVGIVAYSRTCCGEVQGEWQHLADTGDEGRPMGGLDSRLKWCDGDGSC